MGCESKLVAFLRRGLAIYYLIKGGSVEDKDDSFVEVVTTTNASTNYLIGNFVMKGGENTTVNIWVSATDTHGNEGPPSNTCQTAGGGGCVCNVAPLGNCNK